MLSQKLPMSQQKQKQEIMTLDFTFHVWSKQLGTGFAKSPRRHHEIRLFKNVAKYIKGWPQKLSQVDIKVRPFYYVTSKLYTTEAFVCYGQRLIIPTARQANVLRTLHEAHRGIVACKGSANQTAYRPTLNQDIETLFKSCHICQSHQIGNPHQPLQDRTLSDRPLQQLAVDFFHMKGKTYLLTVDYFSKYVRVRQMTTATGSSLMQVMKKTFARFGIPTTIQITDHLSTALSSENSSVTGT